MNSFINIAQLLLLYIVNLKVGLSRSMKKNNLLLLLLLLLLLVLL